MSVVTFGFGQSATRVLTLGFGSAAQVGSYITLGYAESVSKTAMLGLSPPVAAGVIGSYITFGQAQSASLYLRLGMGIGTEIPPVIPPDEVFISGGRRYPSPIRSVLDARRIQQLNEDELIAAFLAAWTSEVIQ